MRRVKGILLTFITAGLVAAVVFFWPRIRPALDSARSAWNEEADRSLPFDARVRRERELLADWGRELTRQGGAVAEAAELVRQREDELEELTGQEAREAKLLRRAKQLLEQGREEYEIAGLRFSRAAVAADARRREQVVERLRARIRSKQRHADRLRESLAAARAALDAARERRQALADELSELTDRERAAGVLARANSAAEQGRASADGPARRLRQEMNRLRADVAAKEGTAAADSSPIPYDGEGANAVGPSPASR